MRTISAVTLATAALLVTMPLSGCDILGSDGSTASSTPSGGPATTAPGTPPGSPAPGASPPSGTSTPPGSPAPGGTATAPSPAPTWPGRPSAPSAAESITVPAEFRAQAATVPVAPGATHRQLLRTPVSVTEQLTGDKGGILRWYGGELVAQGYLVTRDGERVMAQGKGIVILLVPTDDRNVTLTLAPRDAAARIGAVLPPSATGGSAPV